MNTIHVKLNDTDDVAVIRPHGTLSVRNKPVIGEFVDTADVRQSSIIVDLSDVKMIDSSGLGDLIGSLEKVRKRGGHLVLACTPPTFLPTLELMKVDQLLKNYDSVAAAIADLQKRVASSGAGVNRVTRQCSPASET